MKATTINLSHKSIRKLKAICKVTNSSQNSVIKFLITSEILKNADTYNYGKLIQYQKPDKYKKVYVNFKEDEIEHFKEVRHNLKISLSLAVARAIDEYYCKTVKKKEINEFKKLLKEISTGFFKVKIVIKGKNIKKVIEKSIKGNNILFNRRI